MCYSYGYSWVMIGNFQIFMNLLLLAPIGIIVGIVARRVNAVTYLDVFKAKYQNKGITLTYGFSIRKSWKTAFYLYRHYEFISRFGLHQKWNDNYFDVTKDFDVMIATTQRKV